MKHTALTNIHEELGAKMVPFAGFLMPVQYKGVKHEHHSVRQHVGVFDVSHMGEFLIEGPQSLALLQKLTSNDVSKLVPGQAQYSCLPNDRGGIVDDLIVYKLNDEAYLLVVNAANIEKDWEWIVQNNTVGASLKNVSDNYALLAVQGPKAQTVMQQLTEMDLAAIPFYQFRIGTFAGIDNVIISATGYTGSGGFEIYCTPEDVSTIWKALFEKGAPHGIEPIGLAARDTLRLEMGYCLYGNDIDETTSPLEAGLGWITKLNKNFINASGLREQKEEGLTKKLVGFELLERGIPRQDYNLYDSNGNLIGRVTSGTMSPSLDKGIGLGYVSIEASDVGHVIFVEIRQNRVPARIVRLPFYKA